MFYLKQKAAKQSIIWPMDAEKQLVFSRLSVEVALGEVVSDKKGLSTKEAADRLRCFGQNNLRHRPAAASNLLIRQACQPLVLALAAATVLATFVHATSLTVLLAAATLGNLLAYFYQAKTQECYFSALAKLMHGYTTVIRHGRQIEISSNEVVPGDIVSLHSGDIVSADLRLIQQDHLQLDNANLTGESRKFRAETSAIGQAVNIFYAQNIALSGARVAAGDGQGVVIATGGGTALGRILAADQSAVSQGELARLVKRLLMTAVLAVALVSLAALAGEQTLLQSLALALAALVSLLPLSVNLATAIASSTEHIVRPKRQKVFRPLLQCALVDTSAIGLLAATGIAGQLWLHIPLALSALDVVVLLLIFQLPLLASFGHELARRSTTAAKPNLKSAVGFGLAAGGAAYANYLFVFWWQGVNPTHLDTSSNFYLQASLAAFTTVMLNQFINMILTRHQQHSKQYSTRLLATLGVAASASIAVFCMVNETSTTLESFGLSIIFAGGYLGLRLLQRHTRQHSRQAVLALQHQLAE